MSTPRGHRWTLVIAAAVAVAAGLSGCVGEPMPTPSPSASASSTPEPTAESDPILRPGGSAAANQQFFDFINMQMFDERGRAPGRDIVDALVAGGFIKQDMEVTADSTPTGRAADSIIVSVRIKGECLIGQYGANGYVGTIAPLLGTGSCLVGQTRPIDW